jgi:hypothetical protein
MKSRRIFLTMIVLSLSAVAFAQSDAHAHSAAANGAPASEAQKSFDMIKALAGTWNAKITIDPPLQHADADDRLPQQVSMKVTSRGNALVHEMYKVGVADDPTKFDHPVTMLYLDGDHLTLVHYCDAGNRPRMVARPSADGKTVEFDLVDISGSTKYGNMQHAVFTVIDSDHHTEDWTYMMPGNKPMHAHFDLQRAKTGNDTAGE